MTKKNIVQLLEMQVFFPKATMIIVPHSSFQKLLSTTQTICPTLMQMEGECHLFLGLQINQVKFHSLANQFQPKRQTNLSMNPPHFLRQLQIRLDLRIRFIRFLPPFSALSVFICKFFFVATRRLWRVWAGTIKPQRCIQQS